MEQEIQHLRELERSIVKDLQNANNLIEIKNTIRNDDKHKDIRTAGIHCLRRVFIELAENEFIQKGKEESQNRKETTANKKNKNISLYQWFLKQYSDFQSMLMNFLSSSSHEWAHALVVRTFLEIIKIDSNIFVNTVPLEFIISETNFPIESYRLLLKSLIESPNELDVDLLIMLKDETFIYHDCLYFALYLIEEISLEIKEELKDFDLEKQILINSVKNLSSSTSSKHDDDEEIEVEVPKGKKKSKKDDKNNNTKQEKNKNTNQKEIEKLQQKIQQFQEKSTKLNQKKKNLMDLLRMIFISKDLLEEPKYWITFDPSKNYQDGNDDEEDSNDDGEGEENYGGFHEGQDPLEETGKTIAAKKNSILGKRKQSTSTTTNNNNNKKRSKVTFITKLMEYKYYQNLFSKNWITLLSLQWNLKEHKILLQHLLTYSLLKEFSNPLLFADYLTNCYSFGGILSILSLEMLLFLIMNYNLDYPNFFQSLYSLCNLTMMESKYAMKFLSLLSLCLKSSNIPEMMIFSFIKRLSNISIHITSNRIIYCLKQIIWLLKQYKNSQRLIHRKKKNLKNDKTDEEEEEAVEEGGEGTEEGAQLDNSTPAKKKSKKSKNSEALLVPPPHSSDFYRVEEESDFLHNNAAASSLYELELLENHYLYHEIAQVVETIRNPETTSAYAPPINLQEYTNITVQSLIEKEFQEMKSSNYANCALAYKKPTALFV